jgi:acyl-lipid omega-6 desaturase (Delta-12 desaturase)
MNKEVFKANNSQAIILLISPIGILLATYILYVWGAKIPAIFLFSIFLTQHFILLHEYGHLNFFENRRANMIMGHISGLLSGIPFYTWVHMHNLHHKWTGWRDLDPTTEPTVKFKGGAFLRFFVNLSWWLFIPIFFLAYKIGNYWNLIKIKKYVPETIYRKARIHVAVYFTIYTLLFVFLPEPLLLFVLPSFLLSLVWKELLIMTQHNHIEIPVSEGKEVKPIRYKEQVAFTRSIKMNSFIAKYFLFNFNLHEAHHAQPGTPAYFLQHILIENQRAPDFSEWLLKSKTMKGEDYIFKTSKETGKVF